MVAVMVVKVTVAVVVVAVVSGKRTGSELATNKKKTAFKTRILRIAGNR
jgi:hypothetical protein